MKTKSISLLFFVVSIFIIINSKQNVDLIIHSSKIYSVDKENSIFEAVAIKGNRIIFVGSNSEVLSKFKSSKIINAENNIVLPGFIDSHAHIFGLAKTFIDVELVGTKSVNEIINLLKNRAKNLPKGSWIFGNGWDQNDWDFKNYPNAKMLDIELPNNPVVLQRIDGHAIWVNSLAMEFSNISKNTNDVEGGKIFKDNSGNPTGIFLDNAIAIMLKNIPPINNEIIFDALDKAFENCLSVGLTTVNDMGTSKNEFLILDSLRKIGKLKIRINSAADGISDLWKEMLNGKFNEFKNKLDLSLHTIKLYSDGALGSSGAALNEPYSDSPENRGLLLTNFEELKYATIDAIENNYQVATHAIGDRGNKIILDAYEEAQKSKNNYSSRLRIEHAQVIDDLDFERISDLNVIPSMQTIHSTSDMYWAASRLGPKRVKNSYAWRKVLNQTKMLANGSDFPVESNNPLLGFYAAITRQNKDGVPKNISDIKKYFIISEDEKLDSADFINGWYQDQKMTRDEALRSYTIWGAFAEKKENEKGSIEIGKLADLIILSKNIMEIEPKEILTTKVKFTIVNGKIMFEQN